MKTFGKVKEYDGYNGIIKGVDGNNYILMSREITDKKELKINDNVSFEPDFFETPETEAYIARFVTKIKEKEINK